MRGGFSTRRLSQPYQQVEVHIIQPQIAKSELKCRPSGVWVHVAGHEFACYKEILPFYGTSCNSLAEHFPNKRFIEVEVCGVYMANAAVQRCFQSHP